MKIYTDDELVAQCDQSVRHRRRVEIQIARRVLTDLRAAGYDLAVEDGGDKTRSENDDVLINAIFAVDVADILARKDGKELFVMLVMGNDGHDVISDYSMTLDPILDPILKWTDTLE